MQEWDICLLDNFPFKVLERVSSVCFYSLKLKVYRNEYRRLGERVGGGEGEMEQRSQDGVEPRPL